jgi:hypothetical protein
MSRRGLRIVLRMGTVDLILEKARLVPDELQRETLHFVDYLLARRSEQGDSRGWARFSAEQLAGQYAESDGVLR